MRKYKITQRLKIMALTFSVASLAAQTNTGTTIAQFILIEPSARYLAMGNAGSASTDDITAAYYNPAAIGTFETAGAQFTHSPWLAGITHNYLAGLIPMGRAGNLHFSMTTLNSGEMTVRTVEQPLGTGEKYSVENLAAGIGYGKKITDRLSVGLQANYIQESIWHSSLKTISLNVGTLFELIPQKLSLGTSVSNFGVPAAYDGWDLRILYDQDPDRYGDNGSLPGKVVTGSYPLPILFRVGLKMPLNFGKYHKIQIAADALHPNDNTESVNLGAEYMFRNLVAVRAGYQNLFLKDSEEGLTLGGGLYIPMGALNLVVDYAWADRGRLIQSQHFTLGFLF